MWYNSTIVDIISKEGYTYLKFGFRYYDKDGFNNDE